MSVRILPGDYGYSAPLSSAPLPWWLLGTVIQIFQRDKGEALSIASHKFGHPEGGALRTIKITEAASPVWHTVPAERALRGKRFCIWRRRMLRLDVRAELGRRYVKDGLPYNSIRIAAHAADRIVSWIKALFGSTQPCRVFRGLAFLPTQICSTGIDKEIAWATGDDEPFGVPWRQAQPDDGHDYDLAHEGLESEQVIPPAESGLRWTTWDECVARGWV